MASGKKLEICAVWPANFLTAFDAFIGRERRFDARHFYRTHSQSRQTLLKVSKKYPDIPIMLIISDYDPAKSDPKMVFGKQNSKNRNELIEFIAKNQYTEEEIKQAHSK